jgi:excisionase family DNA binding protein
MFHPTDPTSHITQLEPMLVSRRAAAVLLSIGLTKLDALVSSGQISSVKIGRSTMIPMAALQRFIESLSARQSRQVLR